MKNTWRTINKLMDNFHSREEVSAMETTVGLHTDSQHIAEFQCGYFANEEQDFAIKRGLTYAHLGVMDLF